MRAVIEPSKADGIVDAPPSKSYAHRLLLGCALMEEVPFIGNLSLSNDIQATIECADTLRRAFACSCVGGVVTSACQYPCGESGSTLRFFIPVALAVGSYAIFTGTTRLMERGIGVYEDIFRQRGIEISKTAESIILRGSLTSGDYVIPGNISSQFATGLLYALPLLDGDSTLTITPPVESRPYIDITLDVLKKFGIVIDEPQPNLFRITGSQTYRNAEPLYVEGDWSNAAALLAYNCTGGDVVVTDLNSDSRQGDKVCKEMLNKLSDGYCSLDLANCPDLAPVLFAAAAACHGAEFTGTARLRIKESDRAAAMAEELAKFGIVADVLDNSVIIHNGVLKKPNELLWCHNDHRIVMALTLLASVTGGELDGVNAVGKSFPDFFEKVGRLGIKYKLEE